MCTTWSRCLFLKHVWVVGVRGRVRFMGLTEQRTLYILTTRTELAKYPASDRPQLTVYAFLCWCLDYISDTASGRAIRIGV